MLSSVQNVIERLVAIYVARTRTGGAFVATTIAAAGAAAGSQAIPTVGVTTGLPVGAAVRIGSGEQMELVYVASLAANQINTVDPLLYDHVATEAVVELALHDQGDVLDDGAKVTVSGQQSTIEVSTRRLALTKLAGFLDLGAEFRLPAPSIYSQAFALGIPLANISSLSGVTSLVTDLTDCGAERDTALVIMAVLHGGALARIELWGCDYDYSGFSVPVGIGQTSSVPVKVVAAAGGVVVTGASALAIGVTTFKPQKTDVIAGLTEIGVLAVETATTKNVNTTTTAGVVAGGQQLNLTDPSKAVANSWLKVGGGDTAEYHQVAATTTANPVTLKSKLLRAHAIGEAVVAYKEVPFGIPEEKGATFAIKGNGDVIRSGARRLSVGRKYGFAEATFSFAVVDLNLTNVAQALGIDTVAYAAQIAAGRLPLTSANIGATDLDVVYVKAATKGGKTAYFNGWGCTQDISQFAITVAQKGVNATPFSLAPGNAVHFQVG